MESEIDNYYKVVHSIVIKCGEIFREGFYGKKIIKEKCEYYDLVTDYDSRIEDIIIKELTIQFPNHKFIGEESEANKNITNDKMDLTDDPTWIIDPIDGTCNYIQKIPHCCISIGLAINKTIVLGIVFNPIANELYTAQKNCGAYLNGEKIHVSDCKMMQQATVAMEMSFLAKASIRNKTSKRSLQLGSNSRGMRSFGCAALSLCYVAKGILDCYHIEDLYPWDVAAGQLIIKEAGGVIYHTSGGKFNLMKPDVVCASTEDLCQEMIKLIEKADQMKDIF